MFLQSLFMKRDIVGPREVLKKVSLLLAPFAPYISEYIYKDFEKESVHLSNWPKTDNKLINKELESAFDSVLSVIEEGLAERDKAKIGLKWPLAKAVIFHPLGKIAKEYQEIIKKQLNIKELEFKKGKLSVKLNTKMTAELEAEGYAREVSRKVQAARKKAGLIKTDKIKLGLVVSDEFRKIIESQLDFIGERTNSNEVLINPNEAGYKHRLEEKIKDKSLKILLRKI